MFTLDYDEKDGLIRFTNEGVATVEEVRKQYAAALRAVERARRDFGHVKMLVLSSGVQASSEALAESESSMWPMTDPRDRLAIIVSSSLAKVQATQSIQNDKIKAFLSESAAITWLMADRQADLAKVRAA